MKKSRCILVGLPFVLAIALVLPVHSEVMSPQEAVNLYSGDKLTVKSDQPTIQRVVIRGNLSAASISSLSYPARNFTLTSNATELYTLNLWLSYPGPYTTSIVLMDSSDGSTTQLPSYYVSNGDLNLTIFASFQTRPGTGTGAPLGWSSFYDWVGQFGGAFPLWVRILFLVLGVQFAFVGYRWVKFEDERRRLEGHLPPIDRGNKVYLWTDILFRGLLTAFAISLAIMVGEVLIILLAKYLFFVDLSLVSLVDFFSLFFVAALGSIIYLAREGLDRLLDLKPIMED